MRSRTDNLLRRSWSSAKFEHVRHLLPFRALADELDWVAVNPLVPHRVMEDGAHEISNLRSRCLSPA